MKKLLCYLKGYEKETVLAPLFKMLEALFELFVPLVMAAVKLAPARYWSNDGVHHDLPGRQLMANMWMEATGLK